MSSYDEIVQLCWPIGLSQNILSTKYIAIITNQIFIQINPRYQTKTNRGRGKEPFISLSAFRVTEPIPPRAKSKVRPGWSAHSNLQPTMKSLPSFMLWPAKTSAFCTISVRSSSNSEFQWYHHNFSMNAHFLMNIKSKIFCFSGKKKSCSEWLCNGKVLRSESVEKAKNGYLTTCYCTPRLWTNYAYFTLLLN